MHFRDLLVYQKAFKLAMDIFEVSKTFPKEEMYSLTDQIRRSSRSTCVNIAEAYRKRQYPKHFLSKLSDSDAENSETLAWLDFAIVCKYIEENIYLQLSSDCDEVGRLINYMILHPEKYGSPKVI